MLVRAEEVRGQAGYLLPLARKAERIGNAVEGRTGRASGAAQLEESVRESVQERLRDLMPEVVRSEVAVYLSEAFKSGRRH